MSIFLAIEIPEKVKLQLEKQLTPLKEDYPQFNWISLAKSRIMLHTFEDGQNIEKIKKHIETAIFDIPTFHIYSLGGSILIHHNITLYVDFRRQKILEQLVERIREAVLPNHQLSQLNKFAPRIPIARNKIPSKQQYLHLKKKLEQLEVDIDFPVNTIYLYQQVPHTQASQYKKIGEFSLVTE